MDYFDATNIPPSQGGGAHPIGIFDATISGTMAAATKDKSGGMFVVEFTTPVGRIDNRYNLWNQSLQAVEIASKQLSALCHATGVFRINFPKNPDGSPNMPMAGAELRNARCKIEVAEQLDKERKPTGYVEVKRVLDTNGNEPGRAPASQPQPQAQQSGTSPGPAWGAQAQPNNPTQGNGQWQPGTSQAQPQSNAAPGGWQQQPQGNANANPNPPWGSK